MSEKSKLTVKEQMEQLDKAIAWFDGDDFNLEEAFKKYETAAELAKDLEDTLVEMKNKVKVLSSLHPDKA